MKFAELKLLDTLRGILMQLSWNIGYTGTRVSEKERRRVSDRNGESREKKCVQMFHAK